MPVGMLQGGSPSTNNTRVSPADCAGTFLQVRRPDELGHRGDFGLRLVPELLAAVWACSDSDCLAAKMCYTKTYFLRTEIPATYFKHVWESGAINPVYIRCHREF